MRRTLTQCRIENETPDSTSFLVVTQVKLLRVHNVERGSSRRLPSHRFILFDPLANQYLAYNAFHSLFKVGDVLRAQVVNGGLHSDKINIAPFEEAQVFLHGLPSGSIEPIIINGSPLVFKTIETLLESDSGLVGDGDRITLTAQLQLVDGPNNSSGAPRKLRAIHGESEMLITIESPSISSGRSLVAELTESQARSLAWFELHNVVVEEDSSKGGGGSLLLSSRYFFFDQHSSFLRLDKPPKRTLVPLDASGLSRKTGDVFRVHQRQVTNISVLHENGLKPWADILAESVAQGGSLAVLKNNLIASPGTPVWRDMVIQLNSTLDVLVPARRVPELFLLNCQDASLVLQSDLVQVIANICDVVSALLHPTSKVSLEILCIGGTVISYEMVCLDVEM